jgi:asparagine synthase (glutamine-hydrolysing)
MCGIAGILNLKEKVNKDLFISMSKVMSYRGPDDEGYLFGDTKTGSFIIAGDSDTPATVFNSNIHYSPDRSIDIRQDTSCNLALCNRRLAILDLSPAGHQPMSNDDQTIWIVHNGEIYNYVEIREELKKKGYKFCSNSDTEVIIKAYEEWDVVCLSRFNGMWAFCIWDIKKRRLFCARDRFGIKPFYFYFDNEIFAFASEIKSLLKLNIRRNPNDAAIYDFLQFGILDHKNDTFFNGIQKLQQSHYFLIDSQGNITIKQYWDLNVSNEIEDACEKSKYADEFLDVFTDAVRLRLRSDVPIGSCLSGGLDSSSIVCQANNLLFSDNHKSIHEWQKTFSSCFENKRFDEREYIEEVVKLTNCDKNYVFPNPEQFLNELDNLLYHQEEPFGGTSIYAQWCVMKRAREKGVIVMLDGQGGDEQLAGYRKFYVFYILELLKNNRYYKSIYEFLNFFFSVEVIKTLGAMSGLRYFKLGNKLLNIEDLFIESFKQKFHQDKISFAYQGNLGSRIKDDLFKFSVPVLLRYEDKNSMAHSVETRLPFLDHRLVELLASFPLSQKMQSGWTKYVLRNSMKGILPEKIRLRKSKLGFVTPEDIWFKEILSNELKKVLRNSTFIKSYVKEEKLKTYLDKYFSNKALFQNDLIFRFFILELWGRKYL